MTIPIPAASLFASIAVAISCPAGALLEFHA
jgi:hypothetical protein